MPFSKKNNSGFTLIELLVAITLIAVISLIGFTSYSRAQIVARDARRKQDLRSLAQALELYNQTNGHFPLWQAPSPNKAVFSSQGANWIPSLSTNYINVLPQPPFGYNEPSGDPALGFHGYEYEEQDAGNAACPADVKQQYELIAVLENHSDPDRTCNSAGDTNCTVFTNPCEATEDGGYCEAAGLNTYCILGLDNQ